MGVWNYIHLQMTEVLFTSKIVRGDGEQQPKTIDISKINDPSTEMNRMFIDPGKVPYTVIYPQVQPQLGGNVMYTTLPQQAVTYTVSPTPVTQGIQGIAYATAYPYSTPSYSSPYIPGPPMTSNPYNRTQPRAATYTPVIPRSTKSVKVAERQQSVPRGYVRTELPRSYKSPPTVSSDGRSFSISGDKRDVVEGTYSTVKRLREPLNVRTQAPGTFLSPFSMDITPSTSSYSSSILPKQSELDDLSVDDDKLTSIVQRLRRAQDRGEALNILEGAIASTPATLASIPRNARDVVRGPKLTTASTSISIGKRLSNLYNDIYSGLGKLYTSIVQGRCFIPEDGEVLKKRMLKDLDKKEQIMFQPNFKDKILKPVLLQYTSDYDESQLYTGNIDFPGVHDKKEHDDCCVCNEWSGDTCSKYTCVDCTNKNDKLSDYLSNINRGMSEGRESFADMERSLTRLYSILYQGDFAQSYYMDKHPELTLEDVRELRRGFMISLSGITFELNLHYTLLSLVLETFLQMYMSNREKPGYDLGFTIFNIIPILYIIGYNRLKVIDPNVEKWRMTERKHTGST